MATETSIVREAPEIEAYKLGLLESAQKLADQPITLPTQQIAGMSQLQQDAISAAAPATGGIGGYQQYLQGADTALTDARSTLDPSLQGLSQFMNPYQQAIQNEINRSFNIQASQAGQQAAGAGAFGGSRAAVQQAEIGRNRAAALAQAQAQNFLQAQQAAGQQLDRGMAAGQAMAGLDFQTGEMLSNLDFQTGEAMGQLGLRQAALGDQSQTQALRDIETQFNLGKQQQAQQQAELEAQRQSEMAQLYEPYQRLGFLSDIYKGAPTSQQTLTSSTAPGVSPAQQFLGLGIAGLSAASGAQKAGLFG